MKMLIVSDIHGNWPALRAVLEAEPKFDQILCLGDLVNYGPQPVECVMWAKEIATDAIVLQGNHDRALGLNIDPHCSAAYETLAAATQQITERMLTPDLKAFLVDLRPLCRFQLGKAKCFACHASARDPLYHYLPAEGDRTTWEAEWFAAKRPDFLFYGHTHLPMTTSFYHTSIVNPGSVGQPKDGDPRASYAIWKDGKVTLQRVAYDVEETVRAYEGWGLEPRVKHSMCEVLRTGGHLPDEHGLTLQTQMTHG
jgi:predicted phosphodiesterase